MDGRTDRQTDGRIDGWGGGGIWADVRPFYYVLF